MAKPFELQEFIDPQILAELGLSAEQIAYILNLNVQDLALISVQYGAQIAAALFAARTLTITITRAFGLYDAKHYSKWPRIPYRPILKIYFSIKLWWERLTKMGRQATGSFASSLAVLPLLYKKGRNRLYIGRLLALSIGLFMPVMEQITRHGMLVAGTGGGKTTQLITMIHNWMGSVFIIDPKGQTWYALAHRDKRRWHRIAPYKNETDCWNVFDDIKAAIERGGLSAGVRWAFRVADALIITPPGSRTPYFTEAAKGFIAALILHIISFEHESNHHLAYLYELLCCGYQVYDGTTGEEETNAEEAWEFLLTTMRKNEAFSGAVKKGVTTLERAAGETTGNVVSTAIEQLKWLGIPCIQELVKTTTIPPLSELKTTDDYVLEIDAPIFSLRQELRPFARLLTNCVMSTFEEIQDKNGQTLAVLDEMPSLQLEVLEVALPVLRSMGVSVVGVTQDYEILKKAHPQSWQGFMGNADFVICMATNDDFTADRISKSLGTKTYIERDPSGRKIRREEPVMTSDHVKRFLEPDSGNIIVFRNGKRPLMLKGIPYFKELPVWAYTPDPNHKEAILRRLSRLLFDWKRVKRDPPLEKRYDPETGNQLFTYTEYILHARDEILAEAEASKVVDLAAYRQKRSAEHTES